MNAAQPRIDLVLNLLRRSLDPVASKGEATIAAVKMAIVARRECVGFDAVAAAMLPVVHRPAVKPEPKPDPFPDEAWVFMPFGKHVGQAFIDIGRSDPSYLAWVASKVEDEYLRDAARVVLKFLRGGK